LPGVFNNGPVNGALWTMKIEVMFFLIVPCIVLMLCNLGTLKKQNIFLGLVYIAALSYVALCNQIGRKMNSSIIEDLSHQLPGFMQYFATGIFAVLNYDFLRAYEKKLIVPAVIILFLLPNKNRFIKRKALILSLIFMLLLIVSVIRSLNILIFNDIFELGKPIYFLLFFSVSYSVQWDNNKLIKYFSYLMSFLLAGAFVGIGESLNKNINKITALLYKGSRQVLENKAVFSFISPYIFATILLLPIFFYFIRFLGKKNHHFLIDLIRFLILLLCFF
jgi:hypothetical protein